MLKRLFGLGADPNRQVIDALYGEIVAAARQQDFYARLGVPDTPLGRYEMLALHVFLVLERARGASAALASIAQDVTDEFFKDVEHSLRELGIGDMGVPKRMKKLARMFYGRAEAYRAALGVEDPALAEALARNVRPDVAGWPGAAPLAGYARASSALLASQPDGELVAGRIVFPRAGEIVPR